MPQYCQFVIGPAGAGKSTYCATVQEHCAARRRRVRVANLDPAADALPYDAEFDVRDLVTVDDVMETLEYGPNGALVHCIEYLRDNLEWLRDCFEDLGDDECAARRADARARARRTPCASPPDAGGARAREAERGAGARRACLGAPPRSTRRYVLLDMPGQLELYTHHGAVPELARALREEWDVRAALARRASLSRSPPSRG